jgi:hypothetical protein
VIASRQFLESPLSILKLSGWLIIERDFSGARVGNQFQHWHGRFGGQRRRRRRCRSDGGYRRRGGGRRRVLFPKEKESRHERYGASRGEDGRRIEILRFRRRLEIGNRRYGFGCGRLRVPDKIPPMLIIDCHAHIYSPDEKRYQPKDNPLRPPKGKGSVEDLRKESLANGVSAVRAIQNVLSELGYYVPITYNRMTRAITCVGVLREVYRYGSAMALRDVLTVANQAWPNDSHATDEKILYGLHVFLGSFRIQADRDRLVKRLKTTTPLAILADANASRRAYHDGARKIVAHEILNLYNYRISDANRLSGEKIHRFRSSPRSGGLS